MKTTAFDAVQLLNSINNVSDERIKEYINDKSDIDIHNKGCSNNANPSSLVGTLDTAKFLIYGNKDEDSNYKVTLFGENIREAVQLYKTFFKTFFPKKHK
jgi:hypothetical protein